MDGVRGLMAGECRISIILENAKVCELQGCRHNSSRTAGALGACACVEKLSAQTGITCARCIPQHDVMSAQVSRAALIAYSNCTAVVTAPLQALFIRGGNSKCACTCAVDGHACESRALLAWRALLLSRGK